jgi:DNA sulfur modification protein DndC
MTEQRSASERKRVRAFAEFETKLSVEESLEMTAQSLREYGARYKHWALAYSGGKDSGATVAATVHLIDTKRVPKPESLTVVYVDTRLEAPPLIAVAYDLLEEVRRRGYSARVVQPKLDHRFFVYMLGYGVVAPSGQFRWCTEKLKVDPMNAALAELYEQTQEKFLMLLGVRKGESIVRDERITVSCTRDGGECGQGWFVHTTPTEYADQLSPLLHWRLCNVWDWLMLYESEHKFKTHFVAQAYGIDEEDSPADVNSRTGCVGCNLVDEDNMLARLLKMQEWAYLEPLTRLRPLYRKYKLAENRLGRAQTNLKQIEKRPVRLGPIALEEREELLEEILSIQREINAKRSDSPEVLLINDEEEARIRELISLKTYPKGWRGDELRANLVQVTREAGPLFTQGAE